MRKLTEKQQKYVDVFNGNVLASAKEAGITEVYAYKLHNDPKYPHVQDALEKRCIVERKASILTRQQLQEFWTRMTSEAERDKDKLKASELLARSEAMFIEKHEVTYPDAIKYTEAEKLELKRLAIERMRGPVVEGEWTAIDE